MDRGSNEDIDGTMVLRYCWRLDMVCDQGHPCDWELYNYTFCALCLKRPDRSGPIRPVGGGEVWRIPLVTLAPDQC